MNPQGGKQMVQLPDTFKMGLELELMLTDEHFNALHADSIPFSLGKKVIANTEAEHLDYLMIKYPGSAQLPYYCEGYDLFDNSGQFTDLDVKGIEISTPIAFSFPELIEHVQHYYKNIEESLRAENLRPVCFGTHPVDLDYEGQRGTRSVESWTAAEVAMTTFGIHVNLSMPLALEKNLDRENLYYKFNYAAPALVALSANTPLRRGKPWMVGSVIGKSERSFRRTFVRNVLYFRDDQNFRKEVTPFDMTHRLDLIAAYTAVCLGLMLDPSPFPWMPDTFAQMNIREVAKFGYAASISDRHFRYSPCADVVHDVLARATNGLESNGLDSAWIAPLVAMADIKRCPADDVIDELQSGTTLSEIFRHRSMLSS